MNKVQRLSRGFHRLGVLFAGAGAVIVFCAILASLSNGGRHAPNFPEAAAMFFAATVIPYAIFRFLPVWAYQLWRWVREGFAAPIE